MKSFWVCWEEWIILNIFLSRNRIWLNFNRFTLKQKRVIMNIIIKYLTIKEMDSFAIKKYKSENMLINSLSRKVKNFIRLLPLKFLPSLIFLFVFSNLSFPHCSRNAIYLLAGSLVRHETWKRTKSVEYCLLKKKKKKRFDF